MNANEIKALIKANGAKFFGVTFIKKNGEERTLTGQVYLHPEHTGHNPVSHKKEYITVIAGHDNGKPVYRNVNCDTIKRLSIGGKTYNF
jgi:hypothetical protein